MNLYRDNGWKYHTHVTPNEKDKLKDPLTRAFETFLKELLIDEESIKKKIENYQNNNIKKPYRLLINTRGSQDNIIMDDTNHPIFLKSRFLADRRFKQRLVDYYNPIGIFVKGPKELFINGEPTSQWIIELSIIHIK